MPLHVRDERVLELARKLAERRGVTLTRAVMQALENELRREAEARPLADRIAPIARDLAARGRKAAARPAGKAELDDLWGHD